jgi:ParB family chromosome partitioning protein
MANREKTGKWPVKKLKDHPQQGKLFGELAEGEIQALADDMQRRGQQEPVEILPNGTIICGHQRVRAAKKLGWTHVKVVVRHDLAKRGKDAVLQHLIADNLVRRHLSLLDRARCIRALVDVEKDSCRDWVGEVSEAAVQAKIAKQLGVSLKTVQRYCHAANTPMAVQQACDRGDLPLVTVCQVGQLAKAEQLKIAARIEAGEAAKDVVEEYLTRRDAEVSAEAILKLAAKQLSRMCHKLQDRIQEIRPRLVKMESNALHLGRGLIDRLLERAEEQVEEYADEPDESNGPTDGDGEEE